MTATTTLREDLLFSWTPSDDAEAQAWLDSHAAGYSEPSSSLNSLPDDACALDLLRVVCTVSEPTVFNRKGIFCVEPRQEKVDKVTGELTTLQGCGFSSCQYCACTHTTRLVNAIMMSEPDYAFTLTLVGNDAHETKKKVEKVFKWIRKRHPSLRYIYRVEINNLGGLPHVHGYAHSGSTVTRAEFAEAASAAGAGRELRFERIPGEITGRKDFGAASYFSYPFKALADEALFQPGRELNKRVDKRGAVSYPLFHGRGFFRNGRGGEKLTKRDAFVESWRQRREGYDSPKPTYRKSADDVGDQTPDNEAADAAVATQEPSETPREAVESPKVHKPSWGRTARPGSRFFKVVTKLVGWVFLTWHRRGSSGSANDRQRSSRHSQSCKSPRIETRCRDGPCRTCCCRTLSPIDFGTDRSVLVYRPQIGARIHAGTVRDCRVYGWIPKAYRGSERAIASAVRRFFYQWFERLYRALTTPKQQRSVRENRPLVPWYYLHSVITFSCRGAAGSGLDPGNRGSGPTEVS